MDETSLEHINLAVESAVILLRRLAPNRTGNLADNAITLRRSGKNKNIWTIYVDEKIAPYMVYTNEKWISPKWHGKKNPNENWWSSAVMYIATYISQMLGGNVEFKK